MVKNMDVITTTNNSGNLGIIQALTRSPDADSGSPTRIQPNRVSNGLLKRHKTLPVLVAVGGGGVVYKECLKNHAASMGGHAVDGCGEFMPAETATATDPTSLRCAACGCHRNFHRLERVSNSNSSRGVAAIEYRPQHRHQSLPPVEAFEKESPGSDNNSPPPISSTLYPGSAPHMLLALSSGGAITPTPINKSSSSSQNNKKDATSEQQKLMSGSRKRFRTKFSQEQKEKMLDFAEKIGWKMHKNTHELVHGFCDAIQVHRDVFKVWMHNNKNTLPRRPAPPANYIISPHINITNTTTTNNNNNEEEDEDEEEEEEEENGNGNGVRVRVRVGNSHSSSFDNSNGASLHHHFNNASSSSS